MTGGRTKAALNWWRATGPTFCHYCGRELTEDVMSADHRIPKLRGGSHARENLVPACRPCNNRKSLLTEEEYMAVKHDNKARKALITKIQAELHQPCGTLPSAVCCSSSISGS